MALKGNCPKCSKHKFLTKHHILPRCHFTQGSGRIVYVCRACHDDLEIYIELIEGKNNKGKRNKLSTWNYEIIYHDFLIAKEE